MTPVDVAIACLFVAIVVTLLGALIHGALHARSEAAADTSARDEYARLVVRLEVQHRRNYAGLGPAPAIRRLPEEAR